MALLSLAAIKMIEAQIDALFDKAKLRILGPQSIDKRIFAAFKQELSLPGIFSAASREEQNIPSERTLKALLQNAGQFVDAYRTHTKAQVVRNVAAFLKEANYKGVKTDVSTVLGGQLADVWKKATTDMHRLVDTEASNVRNTGTLEGIIKVNAAHQIEDPVIYFVIVRDNHVCDECVRLHMLEDEVTPRLWKLSSLGHGYHKKGEDTPKLGGLHPHCRCSIVTLMPGYGFKNGFVSFIGRDHDEMAVQRGKEK